MRISDWSSDVCSSDLGLAQLVARVGDPVRERAVVGEQQQALAVVVQPAGRIDARRQSELRQRAPRRHAAIGELAQDVEGFVEGEEHVAGGWGLGAGGSYRVSSRA